mmetsp:Transcript_3234/g.4399  ORF Transcript_3234/g.4399 Transcript_3234/m.4399 type:complete len:211 (-) Transcript_3234:471-1103(-)
MPGPGNNHFCEIDVCCISDPPIDYLAFWVFPNLSRSCHVDIMACPLKFSQPVLITGSAIFPVKLALVEKHTQAGEKPWKLPSIATHYVIFKTPDHLRVSLMRYGSRDSQHFFRAFRVEKSLYITEVVVAKFAHIVVINTTSVNDKLLHHSAYSVRLVVVSTARERTGITCKSISCFEYLLIDDSEVICLARLCQNLRFWVCESVSNCNSF